MGEKTQHNESSIGDRFAALLEVEEVYKCDRNNINQLSLTAGEHLREMRCTCIVYSKKVNLKTRFGILC